MKLKKIKIKDRYTDLFHISIESFKLHVLYTHYVKTLRFIWETECERLEWSCFTVTANIKMLIFLPWGRKMLFAKMQPWKMKGCQKCLKCPVMKKSKTQMSFFFIPQHEVLWKWKMWILVILASVFIIHGVAHPKLNYRPY